MLQLIRGVYDSVFAETNWNVLIIGHEGAGKSTLLEQVKYLYQPNNVAPAGASTAATPSSTAAGPSPLPGTPLPAPAAYMAGKRIRPTVGMNFAKVTHRYAPVGSYLQHHRPPDDVAGRVDSKRESTPTAAAASIPSMIQPLSNETCTLTLWDLGGQESLRPLWNNYFMQCHAVIFVVDSCLYHTQVAGEEAAVDAPRAREIYRANHDTLRALALHPALQQVPFLILGTKADVSPRLTLAELQDALNLIGIAAEDRFYEDSGTPHAGEKAAPHTAAATTTPSKARASLSSSSSSPVAEGGSGSGFGCWRWRLEAVSGLRGDGVVVAFDWLVHQLRQSARQLEHGP